PGPGFRAVVHPGNGAATGGPSGSGPPARSARLYSRPMSEGTVMVIGGAEDKVRDRVILHRFVSLAGGTDATIAVISTASSLGAEAGERYRQVFGDLGVRRVRSRHPITPL